ncbi:FkbM family methyltransferase [Paraburkholderia heleia]|uniref:FkbM family methyltransferase n=1 Tax=Paraburkholderia heleia TaxID=634127 RepID=UPI0031CF375C
MERNIRIAGRNWTIVGDDKYAEQMGDEFEPDVVSLLALMCDGGSQVLDIGANIGCTALALSQIVGSGKVVAVEPVPRTFALLTKNVGAAPNITCQNFAFGSLTGVLPMQASETNLSGAFIANEFHTGRVGHFTVDVPVRTVDEAFLSLGLERLDFIKIDVEGFELDVLGGATEILRKYKPRVVLEMNHFCLNQFRRITLPEFRERLLNIFPYAYAIDGSEYLDFTDDNEAYAIAYEHLTNMRFANIVAGFDKPDLLSRLTGLNRARHLLQAAEADAKRLVSMTQQRDELQKQVNMLREQLLEGNERLAALERHNRAILDSSSWRVTKPIRAIKKMFS